MRRFSDRLIVTPWAEVENTPLPVPLPPGTKSHVHTSDASNESSLEITDTQHALQHSEAIMLFLQGLSREGLLQILWRGKDITNALREGQAPSLAVLSNADFDQSQYPDFARWLTSKQWTPVEFLQHHVADAAHFVATTRSERRILRQMRNYLSHHGYKTRIFGTPDQRDDSGAEGLVLNIY